MKELDVESNVVADEMVQKHIYIMYYLFIDDDYVINLYINAL